MNEDPAIVKAELPVQSKVSAATNAGSDYGILPWGWTQEENNLISNQATYGPLENAEYWEHEVDQSQKDAIISKYGKCFTESMGTLLSDKHSLKRNAKGELTGGDCSGENLGPHNKTYGDLVFRWRLVQRNQNILEHLDDIQSVDTGASN